MNQCTHCGRSIPDGATICTNCGQHRAYPTKDLERAVTSAAATNIISIALILAGGLIGWFVSIYLGVILCLAAELVALIPNTKLSGAIKRAHQPITDKKGYKATAKAITKDVKKANSAFRFSFVLAAIALCLLIIFALLI